MNRRQFLAMTAGGAAAAALAACGDGNVSGIAPKVTTLGPGGGGGGGGGSPSQIVAVVGDYPGLATIGTLVMIDSSFVAVKRTGATTFDAYLMTCTHQQCLTDIVANAFKCPCHFSAFDNNGKVTAGPASSDLAKLTTSYNAATDTLTIT
ncbi:MAG: Rieske 2Fe-2S domain-containing protein [Gemmatimonadota bacterium]